MKREYTSREIEEILADRIRDSFYESQKKLPSDREFMEEFNVSRSTIRTIMDKLIARRLVYRKSGVGIFVEDELVRKTNRIIGFNELIKDIGKTPRTEVLVSEEIEADPILARNMKISIGTKLYYIERKRYVDDKPLLFEKIYIPKENVVGLIEKDLEGRSLYEIYDNDYDLYRKHLVQTVSAVTVDRVISDFLYGTSTGYALKVTGLTYGYNSKLIEYGIGYYHAENFSFQSVLTNGECI